MSDFEAEQERTAADLGYPSRRELNRCHDLIHLDMAQWLGITSWAMVAAAGQELTPTQERLAILEEAAVLAVDKLRLAHGVGLPRDPR